MARPSTTDKYDIRRALVLERLMHAWDKNPNMRLGSLIVEAMDLSTPFDVLVLKVIDDLDLIERIERYTLTGAGVPAVFPEEPPTGR